MAKQLPDQWHKIATGETGHKVSKILLFRATWAAQGYELPEFTSSDTATKTAGRKRSKHIAMVGDYYAEELNTRFQASWLSLLPGNKIGCQMCKNLQDQINRGGIKYATTNRQKIIDATAVNASQINVFVPSSLVHLYTGSDSCKSKIGEALDAAIARAIADDVPKTPATPLNRSIKSSRLYQEAISGTPAPRPFLSPPPINLVWHIWPVPDAWEWHADRLNEILPLITGQIFIGVAIDSDTATLEEVRSRIPDSRIVWLPHPNNATTGEVETVERAFPLLDLSVDSVTIYGHAKGVRPHTRNSEAVRIWTECMYETVSFNVAASIERMTQGYHMFGSFRTFGWFLFKQKWPWHYSGTFFNFRTKAVLGNGVPALKQKYGGVEGWPGDVTPLTEAWCEFRDNSPLKYQYDEKHLPVIISEQLKWESLRFGGVPMEQHVREFDWLVSQLHDCQSILIIGSRHGGMEHHLSLRCSQLTKITSVDIDPLPGNTATELIVGSSADKQIQRRVTELGPFDAVFIDGDHKQAGVRADWEFAKRLGAKRIFFHDFTDAAYHRLTGCEVHLVVPDVLRECRDKNWETSSKVVGCGWGGILQVETS